MVLCAACGAEGAVTEDGRVRALVARPQLDTLRFEAGAVARRCAPGPVEIGRAHV